MAKFGSGKKPAGQGSMGTPKVQPVRVSPTAPTRVVKNSTPTTQQTHRGHRTPGKGGTGTAASGPKKFSG